MTVQSSGSPGDSSELLWRDAERAFCRLRGNDSAGDRHAFVISGAGHSAHESINRLAHEYELKDHLDAAWALRPTELVREPERTMLFVECAGGEPLDRLLRQPMEIERFLRLAVAMSA